MKRIALVSDDLCRRRTLVKALQDRSAESECTLRQMSFPEFLQCSESIDVLVIDFNPPLDERIAPVFARYKRIRSQQTLTLFCVCSIPNNATIVEACASVGARACLSECAARLDETAVIEQFLDEHSEAMFGRAAEMVH